MRIPVIGRDHSLLYYAARGRTSVERTDNVKRARRRLGQTIRKQRDEAPVARDYTRGSLVDLIHDEWR